MNKSESQMNPSERIDQLIAKLTDWRSKTLASIRKTIVHLHERITGRFDTPESPEVERTMYLFTSIITDAAGHKVSDDREKYDCRRDLPKELADKFPDPYYTVRAWRAVVTYLLRQREFLYE